MLASASRRQRGAEKTALVSYGSVLCTFRAGQALCPSGSPGSSGPAVSASNPQLQALIWEGAY